MTTAEHNLLRNAEEKVKNLEASNASLIVRNDELYRALQLSEKQGHEQAEIIRRSGAREYQPLPFRTNRELMGMRQKRYISE